MHRFTTLEEEKETDFIETAIRKKYPQVVRIIKLDVGGVMNKGIYRLCFGNQSEIERRIVLRNLRTLQNNLNEKRTEMIDRTTTLLEKPRKNRGDVKELKGLIIGGIDKNLVGSNHLTTGGATQRAQDWHDDAINIEDLIENCSNPATTINDCLNTKNIVNIEEVNNITAFNPRLEETPSKWLRDAEDTACETLLKIDNDRRNLIQEAKMQRKISKLRRDITPNLYNRSCSFFSCFRGNDVVNLGNIGKDNTPLYAIAMDFIKNGRPMCNKCPDADNLTSLSFDTQYQGFTKANADELIGKLQTIYSHNIIQGDLNLGNIMISPDGGVQLIDWGKAKDLSKATSPEQKQAITNEINDFINILTALDRGIRTFAQKIHRDAQSRAIVYLITNLENLKKRVNARQGGRRKKRRKTRRKTKRKYRKQGGTVKSRKKANAMVKKLKAPTSLRGGRCEYSGAQSSFGSSNCNVASACNSGYCKTKSGKKCYWQNGKCGTKESRSGISDKITELRQNDSDTMLSILGNSSHNVLDNLGQPEIDIEIQLDKLRVGQRYTFYHTDAPDVGIRATFLKGYPGIPENPNSPDIITIGRPSIDGIPTSIPLNSIRRITQYGIGIDEDTANVTNSYLGGRKKRSRKKRKSRKSKRRRRKKIT
jgi:serine/threonine protein kinase